MKLLLAQAMMILGILTTDRLPDIAIEALEAGEDSSALRILAGLMQYDITEVHKVFERVLIEMAIPMLTRSEAARMYAVDICVQIVGRQISPLEGANRIWDASIRVNDPDFHDLDTFVYAASELEDRPMDRDFFEREIVKEARSWASRK